MRAALVGTIVATCAVGAAMPASADVKAGVDAWQQGDYARAVAEWRPLALTGDMDAQFNLGQAYKLGRGVPTDLPIALDWFRKASAQGHVRAADNYGLLLFQQGRRDEAVPYIRKSAERGEPRAQYILGTAHFNGDIVAKDWVMAYALMTRAAAAGLDQASASLSTMDKYISTEQRQKGLAIAADMARPSPATQYASAPVQQPAGTVAVQTPPRRVAGSQALPRATPPGATYSAAPAPAETAPIQTAPIESAEGVPRGRPGSMAQPPPSRAAPPPQQTAPPVKVATQPPPSRKTEPVTSSKPPGPTPSTLAVAKPPPTGGWRVQMGAFREEPRARALWETASSRLSGLSGYKPFLVRGGDVTRLQAGPLRSENDATRLCGQLRAAGYDCVVKQL